MVLGLLTSTKFLCFAGGALAATFGVKALKSQKCRRVCVTAMAKGMQLQKQAQETFQNMKEEAVDICADAKQEVGKK